MKNELRLRIIQINDVYELENFPHFKTLVDQEKAHADCTLVILAGDFLAPSILSSLDKGRGMVDTLNACGITHVCIGNHETDVGDNQLAQRITESNFKWVNTNMRELDTRIGVTTLPHDIVEVTNGEHTRKVGLLGLLTEDPSVYRPHSFADATIEPIIASTRDYLPLFEPLDLDLIIPLTHQTMEHDRDFCEAFPDMFPIIVGGHDHEPYDVTHCGARVIKTGMDADFTALIDIVWSNQAPKTKPDISVTVVPTNSYPADEAVQRRVLGNQNIVRELKKARLFRFSDWLNKDELFSTENNRLGPTNGSRVLCNLLRMGMRVDCCLMNAGNIRGGKVYDAEQEWFTWSDLKAELVFPTPMVVLELPGSVLEQVITYSRRHSRLNPPVATGGYIQLCDHVEYDNSIQKIIKIKGEDFDPDQVYTTTFPGGFLRGIDNHVPLLEWVAKNNIKIEEHDGKPAKLVVVEMFSALVWLELGSFDSIDTNGDGVLTPQEVRAKAIEVFGDDVADLVVDSVFQVADLNQNGQITPVDMMVVQFVASDMLDHIATDEELAAMQRVAAEVLGKSSSVAQVKRMVHNLKHALGIDGTGTISRRESLRVIGEVRRRSLLT